jgi:hypothetical protein
MHDQVGRIFENIASPRYFRAWLCVIGLLALLGCGHGGRIPVEGTVTLDGQPLKNGTIQFRPLAGTNGPTAGAQVVDGKFAVPAQGAPFVGKFRVEITAVHLTGQKVQNPMGNGMVDELKQFLPARYNSESQLQAEVAVAGPNHFEFMLTSAPETTAPKTP